MAIAYDFWATQSSRLAEFGGLGMSFNICRGTLGSFAMLAVIRRAFSSFLNQKDRLAAVSPKSDDVFVQTTALAAARFFFPQ
jgi:hypothetical protein